MKSAATIEVNLPRKEAKTSDESERRVSFAILRAVLALLALWVLHQPLGACGEGHSFRDSQQTLWGSQRDRMDDAEARTSPLFYKAALPKPVRVTPSFLGTRCATTHVATTCCHRWRCIPIIVTRSCIAGRSRLRSSLNLRLYPPATLTASPHLSDYRVSAGAGLFALSEDDCFVA